MKKEHSAQQEFHFDKVRLEPDLQLQAAHMLPTERRALATSFRRYAHQLEVSARLLENQRAPWKRRYLPKLSAARLPWN